MEMKVKLHTLKIKQMSVFFTDGVGIAEHVGSLRI